MEEDKHPTRIDLLYEIAQLEKEVERLKAEKQEFIDWLYGRRASLNRRCEKMNEEKNQDRCPCGCCHVPDYGACQSFEKGANGLCVYCDHGEECHPGNPESYNTPLGVE